MILQDWQVLIKDSGLRGLRRYGEDMGSEHHHQISADYHGIRQNVTSFLDPIIRLSSAEDLSRVEAGITYIKKRGNVTGVFTDMYAQQIKIGESFCFA